jgi:hypothetical protein
MKLILICETKDLLEDVYSRVKKHLSKIAPLENILTRDCKAPYFQLDLHYSSRLRGFCSRGVSMCGQDADIIFIDEAQRVSNEFWRERILPVLQCLPYCRVFSTYCTEGIPLPGVKYFEAKERI